MAGVLGLDLGQTIGWVLGGAVGPMRWGEFPLAQTSDLGKWLRSADPFLQEILPQADAVAVEQPFLGDDYYPARKLIALLGHVHYHAGFVGLSSASIQEIPISTGRLTLAGNGNANAEMMIAAAEQFGLEGIGEHAAHGLGVWKVFVFGKREPIAKRRTRSGPARRICA